MDNDIINNGSSTNAEDMMNFNPLNGMNKRIITGDSDFQDDDFDKNVNTHKLTTFTLVSSNNDLKVGGETRITLKPSDTAAEKNIYSTPRCVYESSDVTIASIDNDGIVYAKKAGTVTIKVTNIDDPQYSAEKVLVVS